MEFLHPFIADIQEFSSYLKLTALASQRILAAMMVIPFFSPGAVAGLPRHAFALSLTPLVVPSLPPNIFEVNPGWLYFSSLALREVAIGLLIGLVIASPLIVLENVGHALDFQSGLSSATVYDPATNQETGPFGRLFAQVAVWLLFGPIGVVSVCTILIYSFELWPVSASGAISDLVSHRTVIASANELLKFFLTLAAPPLIALILVEFGLGLVGRFASQLDVNVSAMPLKTLVAVAGALLMLSYILDIAREERSWSDRALHFMRDATASGKL